MANGSRHSLAYISEVTYGVTPATPVMKPVRHTGATLGLSKEALQSEELRPDRQIAVFRHGAYSVAGDVPMELSYGSFDDLIEAALGGTWATSRTTGAISLAVAAPAGTYTRTVGSFITDGFAIGQNVLMSGFTNPGNNGRFKVTAVTALVLTVTVLEAQVFVTEAAAGGKTIAADGQSVKGGTTRRSFTMERNFGDILDKPYHRITGCEVGSFELSIQANAMVTGTFSMVGQDYATAAAIVAGATYPAASTTQVLDSFTGALNEAGTAIAVITEIKMKLENGVEPRFVVGSKKTLRPSIGRSNLSGTITAFFEDSVLLEKFINETESSIVLTLPDAAGNMYTITIPRVKYNGGQPDVSGEGPITLSLPFQALLDPTTATNIVFERQAA